MKTMTCNQLGGACDLAFCAETFEEIARMSQEHGMEMVQNGDQAHLQAMMAMRELMHTPDAMKNWFEERKQAFEALREE